MFRNIIFVLLSFVFLFYSCKSEIKANRQLDEFEKYELASEMCIQEITEYNNKSFDAFVDSLNAESDFFGLRDLRDYLRLGKETQEEKIIRIWKATHKIDYVDSILNQYASVLNDNYDGNLQKPTLHIKRSREVVRYKNAVIIEFIFYSVSNFLLLLIIIYFLYKSWLFISQRFELIIGICILTFILSFIFPIISSVIISTITFIVILVKKIRRIIIAILFIFSIIAGFYFESKMRQNILNDINESYSEQVKILLLVEHNQQKGKS